jgi:hypothetical protein
LFYVFFECNHLIFVVFAVLHPLFKEEYFKIAGWSAEWIKVAIDLTRYNPQVKETASANTVAKPKVSGFLWIHLVSVVVLTIQGGFSDPNRFPCSTWCRFSSTLRHFVNQTTRHLALWRPHLGRIQASKCSWMVAATEARRKHLQWSFEHGT